MSLKRFLELSDVKAAVAPLRPKLPRKIDGPMKAGPRSTRYTMVGTAFDYLLRFELQRRAPHAVAGKWAAERSLVFLGEPDESGGAIYLDVLAKFRSTPDYQPPDVVGERARAIVGEARSAL